MDSIKAPALLAGRILLSIIFITSGWGKITGYAGTAGYMEAMGVPSILLPLVILTELGGGLAILVGFQTKLVSLALAVFCVFTALAFHSGTVAIEGWPAGALGWINTLNGIMLVKNFALAGGLRLPSATCTSNR